MQLVKEMLPEELHVSAGAPGGCGSWRDAADQVQTPPEDKARSQRAWDSPLAEKSRNALLSIGNQLDRARLLAAGAPESGAWLHALPSPSLGMLLDPPRLRVAVALRVGAVVFQPHQCRCGSLADSMGHHALTCRFSAGRHPRHTALNDVIKRALQSIGIPSILEPTGIDRGDGKRPDGLTIFPYTEGKSLLWDATCVNLGCTCVNTYAATYLPATAVAAGAAAKDAEQRKRSKYSELSTRFNFQPVAFETSGACGPSTRLFVRQLGARLTAATGDVRESAWLQQRLAVAVVRGNAASILFAAESQPQTSHENSNL